MLHFLKTHRRLVGNVALAYTIALVLGTHLPQAALQDFSGHDKSLHFLAYVVLGLLAFAYGTARWGMSTKLLCGIVIGLSVFAAIDEWTQGYVPGRFPSIGDWCADGMGVVSAAITWCLVESGTIARR